MNTRIMICAMLLCLVSTCAIAPPAAAQATSLRTFVSGLGNDTGNCARSTPCRSFAYAINQTSAGGEVLALDPAGYGSVTITKAISLTGPGPGLAQIAVSAGTTGITIAAGTSDAVTLRGIEIDGSSTTGIEVTSAGSVTIADCVLHGNNDGSGSNVGLSIDATNATVAVTRLSSVGWANAVQQQGSGNVSTVADSTVGGAAGGGIVVLAGKMFVVRTLASGNNSNMSAFGQGTTLFIKSSALANGRLGVYTAEAAIAYIDSSTVTANSQQGLDNFGTTYSYGNNNIAGNGFDGTGGLTPVAPN